MRVSRSKDVSFQLPSSFWRVAWSLSKSMWTRLALVVKGIVVWRLVGMEGIVIEGGVCGDMWWGMRWDWDWWRINNFGWEEVCHHGVFSHGVLRTVITSFDMRFWRAPTMDHANCYCSVIHEPIRAPLCSRRDMDRARSPPSWTNSNPLLKLVLHSTICCLLYRVDWKSTHSKR